MHKVLISKSAFKSLKKIPYPWKNRILTAFQSLSYEPLRGEKLWGKLAGKRKLRIWPYRVIYIIDSSKRSVIVLEIGHRQGVYK